MPKTKTVLFPAVQANALRQNQEEIKQEAP